MTEDRPSIWTTPDEERRIGRVALAGGLLLASSVLLGALWAIAPSPFDGWWLAAVVAAGVCTVVGVTFVVWLVIQVKRRTGSSWPRDQQS